MEGRSGRIKRLGLSAAGNRGQYLLIIPSENLLIVRRGYDPAGGERFQLHSFARDVLKALKP